MALHSPLVPQRIGLFGGTFDPPHVGHLVTAVNVRHALRLDLVILMVANVPWQKAGTRPITAAEARYAMVQAAVADVAGLRAGRAEIDHGGHSYTADTLEFLSQEHPGASLFTIVGDDGTTARGHVIAAWGERPAAVFGSPLIAPPDGAIQALVWQKPVDSGVIGARLVWRRDVELIFLLGLWPKVTPDRSSVLASPGGMERYRNGHPHVKPVPILTQLIEQAPLGVVADPFMGSGSTLRAAKDLGRRAIGVDVEERYCELAAKRCAQEVLAL